MPFDCELCLFGERSAAIPSRFDRWREYEAHMATVHRIQVTRDGKPSKSIDVKPLPKADEL